MKILKGYLAKITTWENDADNYRTEELSGLTEDQVKCLIGLCELHYSKNRYDGKAGFGNIYDYPDSLTLKKYWDAIRELINTNRETFFEWFELDDDSFDNHLGDAVGDFLYTIGIRGSDFYTRVFDKIEILYIPEDNALEDVTKKFLT